MLKKMIASFGLIVALAFSLTACGQKHEEWKGKERTLSIIKPDAVQANHIGEIISRFESEGLRVAAVKMVKLDEKGASDFYAVHKGKPFFADLVQFMSSGPIVALVLEGDNAVQLNREIMGATDPSKATKGTIRSDFAKSITQNAVHGSDSKENAEKEILFFFSAKDLQKRF